MLLTIPRGIIYHRVRDDIKWLFQSPFSKLNNYSRIKNFENSFASYIGRKHCLAFPFARTAIYFALKSQKFPAGSEVIMPPITIKAIFDVVLDLGLKPIFVDIDPDTLCFNIDGLQAVSNKNTKAIIITYLFGMVPNIEEMTSWCRAKNLFMIEDFSQCLNGEYNGKKAGSFGDVGVYSASAIKTLDTYGGGLLVCDDETLYNELKQDQSGLLSPLRMLLIKKIFTDLLRNIATNRRIFALTVFPLIKLINFLNPGSVIKHTGERNKEMLSSLPAEWFAAYTSFQADIGLQLLDRVANEDAIRVNNADTIKKNANTVDFPAGVDGGKNIYWQLIAYFENIHKTQRYLHSKKIDASTTSLEIISSLVKYPYKGKTPNADNLYNNSLFIPCYPGLSNKDIDHICKVLNSG